MIRKLCRISTKDHRIILIFTTCVALIYYSWDMTSWKYVTVGDDFPFYVYAKSIVEHYFLVNPFSFYGVYHQNTLLSSVYQAVFLQFFGINNFAWRFSNIVLIIPITIFFYKWIKALFSPQIALLSTIILQCSFYLANFFKVGKNMPQALTLLIICCFLATRCAQKPSKKNFFLLGVFLGLSFYIYIGPIFPLIIWPLLLPLLWEKNHKRIFLNFFFLLFGYVLLLIPALLQLPLLAGPAGKTFLSREYKDFWHVFVNIKNNFFLFYRNFDYVYNHYVAGPYLDIVSRILAFCGTMYVLFNIRKQPFWILILTYALTCIVIGVTSPYAYAPTTRGIFFLPFGALFAGIALNAIRKKVFKIYIFMTLWLIFMVNVYLSQIGVFDIVGHSGTATVFKVLREAKQQNNTQQHFLLISDGNRYNYRYRYILKDMYDLEMIPFTTIKTSQLQCAHFANSKMLVFNYDIPALSTIYNQNCPEYNPNAIQILSPSRRLGVL